MIIVKKYEGPDGPLYALIVDGNFLMHLRAGIGLTNETNRRDRVRGYGCRDPGDMAKEDWDIFKHVDEDPDLR